MEESDGRLNDIVQITSLIMHFLTSIAAYAPTLNLCSWMMLGN